MSDQTLRRGRTNGYLHLGIIEERNALEWRFEPRSDIQLSIVERYDLRVIVICQEGYMDCRRDPLALVSGPAPVDFDRLLN